MAQFSNCAIAAIARYAAAEHTAAPGPWGECGVALSFGVSETGQFGGAARTSGVRRSRLPRDRPAGPVSVTASPSECHTRRDGSAMMRDII